MLTIDRFCFSQSKGIAAFLFFASAPVSRDWALHLRLGVVLSRAEVCGDLGRQQPSSNNDGSSNNFKLAGQHRT